MSDPEHPNGRPPFKSNEPKSSNAGAHAPAAGRAKSRVFDPSQYIQGQPARASTGQDPAGRDANPQSFDDLPPPTYRPRPRATPQSIEAQQSAAQPTEQPPVQRSTDPTDPAFFAPKPEDPAAPVAEDTAFERFVQATIKSRAAEQTLGAPAPQSVVPPQQPSLNQPQPSGYPQENPQQPHHVYDPLETVRRPDAAEAYLFGSPNAAQGAAPYAPQDHSFEASSSAPPPARPVSKTMNGLGALISIALVIGVGVWGYRLAVRDVSGVPVVAALDGPMRIQPEDPGGELASYQGLTVNAVQAEGQAEPTADRLVLAPKPIELLAGDGVVLAPSVVLPVTPTALDRPTLEIPADAPVASPLPEGLSEPTPDSPVIAEATIPAIRPPVKPDPPVVQEPAPSAETDTALTPEPVISEVADAEVETITAPAALDVAGAIEAAQEPTVVPPAATETQAETATEAVAEPPADTGAAEGVAESAPEITVISPDIAGVARSARPLGRPDGFAAQAEAQRAAQVEAIDTAAEGALISSLPNDGVNELAPETLPVGTNLAQLGAYASAEIARAEWGKKAARFDDYMDGKSRVIQRAESGGRAFYRLRAHGFETINEARQFCAALLAENAECIAVVVRE
jgi:hypothetical protein